MTIIQEEELEDSAFISGFNSALQGTTYFKATGTNEKSFKGKNTDLDEVIEEPIKSILKSSHKRRRSASSKASTSPEVFRKAVSPEMFKRESPAKTGI